MRWHPRLGELIHDEKGKLSVARCGLWLTIGVALVVMAVDVHLVVSGAEARVPNTVYALLGTMFTAFAAWAGGPRIAQYLAPQVGQVASGIAAAARDPIAARRKQAADDGWPHAEAS
ncbi:MAG: hypothetical protein U9Q74_01450 [Gemmatimonadota bacterium]|nr:hypothetical protein [Gemmatimonadota bacterium]